MSVSYDEVLADLDGLGELAEFAAWLESQSFLHSPAMVVDLMRNPEKYRPHYGIMLVWKKTDSEVHRDMLSEALTDNEPSPDRLHYEDFTVNRVFASGRWVWQWEPIKGGREDGGAHGIAYSVEACIDAIERATRGEAVA